jgi:RNA polymerase sigma-70 factor (ECF subfamily)
MVGFSSFNCLKGREEMNQKHTAIEQLFRRYHARLWQTANRLLHDAEESKDAVSDVFTRLMQTDYLPETEKVEPYLVNAVRNQCMNILAHHQVRHRVERLLPTDNIVYISDSTEEQRYAEIRRFVDTRLSPQTRRVFQLRYDSHMKYQEIAAELGVSEKTVYMHLHQAITSLHEHFSSGER